MRIPRIYLSDLNQTLHTFSLPKETSRYLLQVLRCKPGQALQLFNGQGLQCSALLLSTDRNSASVSLSQCEMVSHESPLHIRLALGISKGERMDMAIQKAVELGVSEIYPLQTEYSVVHLDAARAEKRLQHWQGIITSACEQCGRNTLPTLHPVLRLDEWLSQKREGSHWIFSPQSGQTLSQQAKPEQGINILIGPEGGLSDTEINNACRQNFTAINFGPRILRTETAAIACISAIQTLWGDLG